MKPEEIERLLQRTPRSGPPAEWRETILGRAREAARQGERPGPSRPIAPPCLGSWWDRIILKWATPSAALAGAWAVVVSLHFIGVGGLVGGGREELRPPVAAERLVAEARAHRAAILALAAPADPAGDEAAATEHVVDPAARPRSDWRRGRLNPEAAIWPV